MLGWLHIATERWTRAKPARLSRVLDVMPVGYSRKLGSVKLVRTLQHVWRHAPVQRERWRRAGIQRADLRSPSVLEAIPFTTAGDLAANPEQFWCVPPDRLIHVLSTSGTKGRPKKIYLTREDLDREIRMIGTSMYRFPGATRAVSIFLINNPTWSSGMIARRGAQVAGMLSLLSGTHRPVSDHIALIREYDVDFIITTPSYLHQITLEADVDVRSLGIKYIQLSGQPWSESFRTEMQERWSAKLIDVYASTEFACGVASECVEQDGLHITEADFWPEVVDPRTGTPLPEGEEGELVLTTVSRDGMPLVRYRTGDLAHLLPFEKRCPCGMPVRKMSRVRGRVDDMLILGGGNNVYPDEFDRAVLSVPGVTDYQLTVDREGYRDVLHLTVETGSPSTPLRETLIETLLSIPMVRTTHETERTVAFGRIASTPRGTLAAGRPKTIRIVDRRGPREPGVRET